MLVATLHLFSCILLFEFSPVMLQLFPYGHICLAFRKLVVHVPSASCFFYASVAHFGETEQFVVTVHEGE